jgi:hypothetical protein
MSAPAEAICGSYATLPYTLASFAGAAVTKPAHSHDSSEETRRCALSRAFWATRTFLRPPVPRVGLV